MNTAIFPDLTIPQPKRIPWLKWLRCIHAWIGVWCAILGLLFGISGILLNHRALMKIPAAHMDTKQVELTLPSPPPTDAKALAKWLQTELHLEHDASRVNVEAAKTVVWAGQIVQQPAQWRVDFNTPQHSFNSEYWMGNATVSVKQQEANVFALLTRLHKGVGLKEGWVLLADTLAGGLVFLSLSGLFMLTKLHGSSRKMIGLGLSSFGLAVMLVLQAL